MTVTDEPVWADAHDRRRALGAPGLLAQFNQAERAHTRPTSTSPCGSAPAGGDRRGGAARRRRWPSAPCARGRSASTSPPSPTCPLEASRGAALPWPEPTRLGRARRPRARLVREEMVRLVGDAGSTSTATGARRARSATTWSPGSGVRRPRSTPLPSRPGSSGCSRATGSTSSAAPPVRPPRRWTTVLTGGPGTGKTTTVAGLLALVAEQHELAHRPPPADRPGAPTGKAAARLQEAVQESIAPTTAASRTRSRPARPTCRPRRCTGCSAGGPTASVRFRHDRTNRLPHDVVVVDETSMVSLTMMARLLEAVRPDARLVLVGDPDQLASVEAGAVLADLVAGFERLAPTRRWRRCARPTASASTSAPSPRRCATATPTR